MAGDPAAWVDGRGPEVLLKEWAIASPSRPRLNSDPQIST